MQVRARVYEKDGNRFLITSHWYCDDNPAVGLGSYASVAMESMMFSVMCGFKAEEWIEVTAGEDGKAGLEHYPFDLVGPQFEHGSVPVLLISGPLFDEQQSKGVT
jgi:hypothetical protein